MTIRFSQLSLGKRPNSLGKQLGELQLPCSYAAILDSSVTSCVPAQVRTCSAVCALSPRASMCYHHRAVPAQQQKEPPDLLHKGGYVARKLAGRLRRL
eukprot:COSAG01_NODE_53653_length_337_cov_1.394958_1_plen_97_part_10